MEWISQEEYMQQNNLELEDIEELIGNGQLTFKIEGEQRLLQVPQKSSSLVDLSLQNGAEMVTQPEFVQKTIGTILSLHEKVLASKDETIASIKEENLFLKDALKSLQEIYDEDRKTIKALQKQLDIAQEEAEFLKRKYKTMWGKTIDEHAQS